MSSIWRRPTSEIVNYPENVSVVDLYKTTAQFRSEIEALCRPDGYNVVLHKHLGDVFYTIGSKSILEKTWGKPFRFIVAPQHEFLMKLWRVDDYVVYDLDSLVRRNKDFLRAYFNGRVPTAQEKDWLDNTVFQIAFGSLPNIGGACVAENPINNFLDYPYYWCFRWASNLGVEEEFRFDVPCGSLDLSERARRALDSLGGPDKTILLLPEAATATELPVEWWEDVTQELCQKGFSVLVNSRRYELPGAFSTFDFGLSLEDVVAIGFQCHSILALRSGITDVLVGVGERMTVIVPAMLHREADGLDRPFSTRTGVREILLYHWDTHPKEYSFEGVDLSCILRRGLSVIRQSYWRELFLSLFGDHHRFWYRVFRNVGGRNALFRDNNEMNAASLDCQRCDLPGSFVYAKSSFYLNNYKLIERRILGGVIVSLKKEASFKLKLLGVPVWSWKDRERRVYRFFGIPVWSLSRRETFWKYFLSRLQSESSLAYAEGQADHVFVIRHNIGETVAYFAGLQEWIRRLGAKRPLLVVWRKRDLALARLFFGRQSFVRYIHIPQSDLNLFLRDELIEREGMAIHAPTFEIAEGMSRAFKHNSCVNFVDIIRESMGLPGWDAAVRPHADEWSRNRAKWLLSHKKITKPFVLLCPQATSSDVLPLVFWETLARRFRDAGYDVLCNTYYGRKQKFLNEAEDCAEPLDVLFAIASEAERVVSVSSGLSILLTLTERPMDIIYTDFRNKKIGLTADMVVKIYSVCHLPNGWGKDAKEHLVSSDLDALLDAIVIDNKSNQAQQDITP